MCAVLFSCDCNSHLPQKGTVVCMCPFFGPSYGFCPNLGGFLSPTRGRHVDKTSADPANTVQSETATSQWNHRVST